MKKLSVLFILICSINSCLAKPLADRIDAASRRFLGKPYVLGPLGEGPQGQYDQKPLYDFERFDCVTYVNTSLALAYAKQPTDFEHYFKALSYRDGQVGYLTRNHFTSLDWHKNNQRYLKDVTTSIVNRKGQPVAVTSTAVIDKGAWFRHKQLADLHLGTLSRIEQKVRLVRLHAQANRITPVEVTIHYLPLTALFDADRHPNSFVFDQIPHGAVVEIVRPNWNLKAKIGTNLHISHMGFAIRKPGQPLIFRQASQLKHQVIDSSLAEYLKGYIHSKTVKGILVLMPQDVL